MTRRSRLRRGGGCGGGGRRSRPAASRVRVRRGGWGAGGGRPGRVGEGSGGGGGGGPNRARRERDAAAALPRRRLAALDIGSAPLCFGRLDLEAEPAPEVGSEAGRVFYVGRIA